MNYLLYLIFGLAPGIIWLLFFLRKDAHPESNRMIIIVFLLGMVIAPFVAFFECLPISWGESRECVISSLSKEVFPLPWGLFFFLFFGAAIEEIFKYLVVRFKVIKNPEFDEPLDLMLYMIIAALGFAAIENIFILFFQEPPLSIKEASFLTSVRFIGATFLHALTSGTLGYFLARSLFEPKRKAGLLTSGFALAIGLHGFFNLSIIKMGESLGVRNGQLVIVNSQLFTIYLITLIGILAGLAIFVTFGFQNLKKIASVCKIK